MYYLAIFIVLAILIITGVSVKHKSLYPFMPFRYNFAKRRKSFSLVLALLNETEANILVETGTSRHGLNGVRSQGAATIVFGKWAKLNNAFLHSVDISKESVRIAQQEVNAQELTENVIIHTSDSIDFLRNFKERVDFLYLDSYDYSDDPEIQLRSQEHNLQEFKAIEERLHKDSIVLIDDCDLPGGGKGKITVGYMLTNGWVIHYSAYQTLLLHNESTILSRS